jgi:hypothetical protein
VHVLGDDLAASVAIASLTALPTLSTLESLTVPIRGFAMSRHVLLAATNLALLVLPTTMLYVARHASDGSNGCFSGVAAARTMSSSIGKSKSLEANRSGEPQSCSHRHRHLFRDIRKQPHCY